MPPKSINEMTTAELSDHFERESAKKVIRVTVIVFVIVSIIVALPGLSALSAIPGKSATHVGALTFPLVMAMAAFGLLTYSRTCAVILCVLSSIMAIAPVIAIAMMPFSIGLIFIVTVSIVMIYLSVQSFKACTTLKRLEPPETDTGTR